MKPFCQIIESTKPHKIDPFFYSILSCALKTISKKNKVKFTYDFDTKEMKNRQVLVLGDHASRGVYKYVLAGYPFAKLHPVVGYLNLYSLAGISFKPLGMLVKKQFNKDVRFIMNLFEYISMGESIVMFPEGRESKIGRNMYYEPQIANLIKQANIDVIFAKSYGAFGQAPTFATYERQGPVEIQYKWLFKKEELKNLSINEIAQRLNNIFQYDDLKYIIDKDLHYCCKKPFASGFEKVLYRCPKCGKEYLITAENNHLICSACGNDIVINDNYTLAKGNQETFLPYNDISQWYDAQIEQLEKELKKEDFKFIYEVDLYRLDESMHGFKGYKKTGHGVIEINYDAIIFKGIENEEEKTFVFSFEKLFCISTIRNKIGFRCIYINECYIFKNEKDDNRKYKMKEIVDLLQKLHGNFFNELIDNK